MSRSTRKSPNPKYQKQHWEHNYGIIPSGWSFVTIGSLFKERTETSCDKDKFPLYSLTIERGVTPKTERYERSFLLNDEEGNEFSLVNEGDFVFNPMNLRFGAIAYSKISFPVLVSAYYNVIIPDHKKIDPDFIEEMLRSYEVMDLYERIAIGSLVEKRRIHLSILNETYIPLPPIIEQKGIGNILAKFSKLIDLAESLIAAKQERRKWLMQQLLTGKMKLSGFDGKWPEVHIRDIFKPVRRKNNKGVTHVLTASGEHGLIDQTEYFNRSVSGESLEGYFLLRRGEFAYNRSSMNGYPFGAIKRLDAYDEGVLSTLYLCFELISKSCSSDFYKHLFEAGVLNKQLRGIVQVGARAHGLLNVTLEDFFAIKVKCPPLEEQKKIASFIDIADREIDLLRSQLEALREQKKGLMQQLLTGKVRVKV